MIHKKARLIFKRKSAQISKSFKKRFLKKKPLKCAKKTLKIIKNQSKILKSLKILSILKPKKRV
ncbi:hypothetical protein [Helicobacter cetorum]|uniref:Uncharacterized protein n=1 Tax=Helicobacter cetorum (strain ATCC BAA-540 / CCUG 52418 / MIT 99-5656) TaxID=1163745 RepID=I0ETA9_HELCM|nr:hypothetical protein [Helicobacter cetorum]AFI06178.1 hypothetical protein HCD_05880 [Helicobacter cetorum MIT 99-5656]